MEQEHTQPQIINFIPSAALEVDRQTGLLKPRDTVPTNLLGGDTQGPPDPLMPEPDPKPSDVPPVTDKTKQQRKRNVGLGYNRHDHDKDIREARTLMKWLAKGVSRIALRAKTYNGQRPLNSYDKELYVTKLWRRFVHHSVQQPPGL